MNREPNTQYVLSLSYGKDSIATLEAIRLLGYPLDRIIHAEVWATDDISADLPPMVEFKTYADKIIKERYGIEVEHICAMRDGEKLTYEKMFYHVPKRRAERERERRMATQRCLLRCDEPTQNVTAQGTQFSDSHRDEQFGVSPISSDLRCKGWPNTRRSWCKSLKTEKCLWKHLRIPKTSPSGGGLVQNTQIQSPFRQSTSHRVRI